MDNDKQIIKSPYYSPEDLKKYSVLLERGLTDIKKLDQENGDEDYDLNSNIGSEFIDDTGKKWIIAEATIKEIEIHTDVKYRKINKKQTEEEWTEITDRIKKIEGTPNDDKILEEKAIILGLFMVRHIRYQTEAFSRFGDEEVKGEKKENFVSLGELFIEIASIYLLFIDHSSFKLLNNRPSYEFFYDTFRDNFIAFALLTNYGEKDAYGVQGAYISDLNKCLHKYSKLPYSDFKEGESLKGTRLWEFVKNILIITNKENGVQNFLIQHVVLADFARFIVVLEKLLSNE